MQYSVQSSGGALPATTWKINGNTITDGPLQNPNKTGITVLLRRVANPHVADSTTILQANGTLNPLYNPFVTTDYMHGVVPQDTANPATTTYGSTYKLEPYASHPSQYQTAPTVNVAAPATATTLDTFGNYNDTNANLPKPIPANPYHWLMHADRQVVSAMELLNVSGFHPHQLTHKFWYTQGANPPVQYGHRADWYNQANRLYRLFEFVGTRDRTVNVSPGGRVPGMININTIWDPEVFLALCDAQAGNGFKQAQAVAIFNQMVALRIPSAGPLSPSVGTTAPSLAWALATSLQTTPRLATKMVRRRRPEVSRTLSCARCRGARRTSVCSTCQTQPATRCTRTR